jgi:hypothetical protein
MAPPLFKVSNRGNSVCGIFEKAQTSDEKSNSISLMENRFRSVGIGESEVV